MCLVGLNTPAASAYLKHHSTLVLSTCNAIHSVPLALHGEVQEFMQALQQLWEPARFTYQVNNPSSQRQRTTGGSKQSAAVVNSEEEEAGSSSSDGEGCLEQPQQTSQVVTRGVEARTDPASARFLYASPKFC